MRFMVIVKENEESEAGILPPPELFEAMGKYNEELVKAGIMLAGEGLHRARRARASSSTARSARSSTGPSPKRRS